MTALLEKTTISQVVQRKVAANESFLDLAKRYAATPGTVVLCSGGEFDSVNSHFLAIHPWLFCEGDRERLSLSVHGETEQTTGCPWQFLEEIHKAFTFTFPVEKTNVASGLFGYLSYELKDYTEILLRTTVDDLHLPLFYFTSPLFVVEQRVEEEFLIISTPCFSHEKEVDALQRIDTLCEQWKEKPPARSPFMATSPYRSCFSKEEYLEAVSKVRSYIRDGDIYQANLSQRFSCSFSGDPFDLFHKLFEENPAPFFSYLNCGSHQIVSSSPERFLSQQGCFLESRPIKGTMPRGFSEQEDVEKKNALLESGKNSAELSMIVDLIRNDLGKVSQTGTVEVVSHKALESYSNVHHLVSVVQGKKRDEVSSVNTLRALFPGGSITGCPKIRAMEIIDEFESVVRHVYTGAIGYLSFHDTMDFSIAIRTAIVKENKLFLGVGGGVVYDSDPEEEYDESLHKGESFFKLFANQVSVMKEPMIWCNGKFALASQAQLPLTSLGAQYGAGLFETVRCQNGRALLLDEHIGRFEKSWKDLFCDRLPDVDWKALVHELVERNGLSSEIAVIKFGAFLTGTTPLLYMQARLFGRVSHLTGLTLKTYPEKRESYLAEYKTNNYLFSYLARQWATQHEVDHSVILNGNGTVSECDCANLLFLREDEVVVPRSAHVLPGVVSDCVQDLCTQEGIPFSLQDIFPEDLSSFDGVLVTNSLIGVSQARCIDGREIDIDSPMARKLMELYEKSLD